MPELPEMEAWRRATGRSRVRVPDREGRPGAHRDAEDVRSAASALEGRRLAGAERRAKRLLFPTDDGELVPLVHLMSAGRPLPPAGSEASRRRRRSGCASRAAPSSCSPKPAKKRAVVWLLTPEAAQAELAHLAGSARPRRGAAGGDPASRLATAALAAPRPAADRRDRPGVGRDPPHGEARRRRSPAVYGRRRSPALRRRSMKSSRAASSSESGARPTRRRTGSTTGSASRAHSAAHRSRAWTSRSTRSTTARAARPAGGC